jgi:uncharacterized protein
MGINKFFWDSYAVIEVIKGNSNFRSYLDEEIIITIFNLIEIYFSALKDLGEAAAEKIYKQYSPSVKEVSDYVLKKAMKYKLKNRDKNLSCIDCIGYVYAIENNLVFLTGDKEFENLENVEFVKK